MMKRMFFLLSLAFGFNATCIAADRVQWRHWEAAAFDEAKVANLPIMVAVGHEGCTACRMMEENTYSDKRVIALLNEHFIPIQVDCEARPDIGERYSDWAWPATAFLKPDGTQVFAIRGSRRAGKFTRLLNRVVERHRAGELKTDQLAPYGAPTAVREGPLADIRAQVREQLDDSFDQERGGWGSAKVLEYAEPTLQLFLRSHLYDDEISAWRAELTANGFIQQTDPVWGGMFYASFGSWDKGVREIRLESQAAALQLFAEALQVTGDRKFEKGLDDVHRYLTTWMTSPEGTFFANQKDLVAGLPPGMDIDEYYALDDQDRRALGIPVIDRAVYTDHNGRVITGLARAYEATGNERYLATALRAARALVDERQTKEGWLRQFDADPALRETKRVRAVEVTGFSYLRAQAHFGLAALALYQATADETWHAIANRIAAGLESTLLDKELGGYFGGPASAVGAIVGRRKPLEDNAAAARFVYLLGVLNKDDDLRKAAERTIRAVAAPAVVSREGRITGSLAVTLELLTSGYVEFSIVGPRDDAQALALIAAARRVYEPRKIVHFEKVGRYPKLPHAAMYICNDDQCSLPISDPTTVALQARQFKPSEMAKVASSD